MKTHRNIQNFVNRLTNKYTHYFDVYREEKLDDIPLAFLAIHKRRDERYLLTRKFKIYGTENQEVVFTAIHEEKLTKNYIENFINRMETNFNQYLDEHDEHMSSILYGIIITNNDPDQTIVKKVSKYRRVKFLKFGLHGWVEFYLIIVNPTSKNVWVHPKGKPLVETIENLFNKESAEECL